MSEVVTGILKFTFGFISNKVRSYGADKLQDGGLTDQKFRGWIVRELDDIKYKLDGLSRKDLATSVSCLKQGVERLEMSFGESTESEDPSAFELPKSEKQPLDTIDVGASTSTLTDTTTKSAQISVAIDDAVALANAIGKLKIKSSEVFELAKESFKEAGKEARRAFHNVALNTDERILASKVRIASGILEHLERPEVAASDCLQYLRELHDLPAVQDIFSVQVQGGIKSLFKKDLRAAVVETVTMINLMLADFISKFTKRRMVVFDWPTITCRKRAVHPIYYDKDSLPNLKEMEITPPWDMIENVETDLRLALPVALNKQGELVCVARDKPVLRKLDKTTGRLQPYCLSPSQDKHIKILCPLAVDEDDTVYVLSGDEDDGYTLLGYCRNGRNTHHCPLEFLEGLGYCRIRMTVTKDKNIVICSEQYDNIKVWLCDYNGELRNSFVVGQATDIYLEYVFVSCNNEVMLVTSKEVASLKTLHMLRIYTEDGHLQRTVTFHRSHDKSYPCLCYNEVTKNIIGFTFSHGRLLLEFFSDQTGELLYSYLLYYPNLPDEPFFFSLVHHRNGTLALIGENYVLFLQKSSI